MYYSDVYNGMNCNREGGTAVSLPKHSVPSTLHQWLQKEEIEVFES
jgi:hypothetical protein